MNYTYNANWLPLLEDRCAVLEALCEGWTQAYQAEMEENKEDFPCCVKCGEFCFCPVPGMLGESDAPISETQREALKRARGSEKNDGGPRSLRIQSARELTTTKRAHAVELAVFQCAANRIRDKDCFVAVDYDETGNVHAWVRYPDGTMKNPQTMTVSTGACSCGNHAEEQGE